MTYTAPVIQLVGLAQNLVLGLSDLGTDNPHGVGAAGDNTGQLEVLGLDE